jgi:CBS domain-containing protein
MVSKIEMQELKVQDYMTSNPISVTGDVLFPDALDIMTKKGIGNLVVKEGREPRGILTEREILLYLVQSREIPDKPLREVLFQLFLRIAPHTSIIEAASMMISKKARLLVFENNNFVGIITASDLVRAFRKTGRNPSLEGIMSLNVVKLPYDDTIFAACKLMHKRRIGSVIVTKDAKPYGIFTERDLLVRVLQKDIDLEEKLGDHCTIPLATALYGIKANDAATIMADNKIKRLPLLKDGKLLAIITARDLVEAFYRESTQVA